MTPEEKLMALMASYAPKQPDPAFDLSVMERLARRQAFERFSRMLMAVVVVSGLMIALAWGALYGQMADTLPIVMAAMGASAIAGLVVWTLGRAQA
ncbi:MULTISPECIES: hypothetical protein [unclassified Brevundimonas]|uniref:hypothetical protein n=1 Tax=unclassified Brevundimonas TaxID=2622653 RepID=UPI0025C0201F|nr:MULTISPECIES: hypothetical protein [unclassified Brevundimonas]